MAAVEVVVGDEGLELDMGAGHRLPHRDPLGRIAIGLALDHPGHTVVPPEVETEAGARPRPLIVRATAAVDQVERLSVGVAGEDTVGAVLPELPAVAPA